MGEREARVHGWRSAALAAAAGLMLPASRSLLSGTAGPMAGDVLMEVGLLGLLAGVAWKARDRGYGAPAAVTAAAMLLLGWAAGLREAGAAIFPLWRAAGPAALGAMAGLGIMWRRACGSDPAEASRELPLTLAAAAAGILGGAVMLPAAGPSGLAAAACLAAAAGIEGRAARVTMAGAFAALLIVAVLDGRGGVSSWKPSGGRTGRPAFLSWRTDGPDVILSKRTRAEVTEGGGRLQWLQYSAPPGRKRPLRRLPVSVAVLGALEPRGPVLALGPAAAAAAARVRPEPGGGVESLIGDPRLQSLFIAASRSRAQDAVFIRGGLRGRLPGRGKYAVVYFLDMSGREALATGVSGRVPAYHLTVEAVRSYVGALRPDGFLVMEVPYSLKMVAILKELAIRDGLPLAENLMVFGRRGSTRDLVVWSPSRITQARAARMRKAAAKGRLAVHYQPQMRKKASVFTRLVYTDQPRGHYAAGTEEFGPPTDDRPFYYQIQKLLPRTRGGSRLGLSPPQKRRFLGMVPYGDLPWVLLLMLTPAAVGLLASPRAGLASREWGARFLLHFVLLGASLGILVQGALMVALRGGLSWGGELQAGLAAALAGMAAGTALAWGRFRIPGRWRAAIMLLAALLPLGLAALSSARGRPGDVWLAAAAVLPGALLTGTALREAMQAGRLMGALEGGAALGVAGLGALLGRELATPLAQTFGLAFTLVTSWVAGHLAYRVLRRLSRGGAPAGG